MFYLLTYLGSYYRRYPSQLARHFVILPYQFFFVCIKKLYAVYAVSEVLGT